MHQPASKPPVSSVDLSKSDIARTKRLSCQIVKPFFKPAVRPSLPPTFKTIEDTSVDLTNVSDAVEKSSDLEFVITILRCALNNDGQNKLPPWSGIHLLVTQTQAPLMRVGFLPVLPEPVTEYATVRKSLTNFQSVRKQLGQDVIPVFCGEGVYQFVMDIMLNEPSTFADIFAMLGTFHMTKVLLRCCGKYLTGSGVDDAMIEGGIFGKKVLVSVLSGGHYVRSLQGMFVISEAIYLFAWKAFMETRQDDPISKSVRKLHKSLLSLNRSECFLEINMGLESSKDLKNDFENFVRECEEKSELCKYFSVFQEMFTVTKNLVAADRDGNWNLHVGAVRAAMPIFRSFDALNYLRYSSY